MNEDEEVEEELVIHLTVRDFNSTKLILRPLSHQISIESEIINLNLTEYVIGPLLKFYSKPNHNSEIHLQYINYYDEINISKYLKQSPKGRLQETEELNFVTINQ